MGDYLEKIDAKASQIRQLSENIFEYSLVSRTQDVVLDTPISFIPRGYRGILIKS